MSRQSRYVTVLGRELHYSEWGEGNRDAVVMWHGLARTGRDFDWLAAHLEGRYRILCPDTIGRGLSQWSLAPETEYSLSFYEKLAVGFVEALKIDRLRWVGTSMGALIGIRVAAGPLRDRISHFLLNDIGPKIGDAALERIKAYAGNPQRFATMAELERYLRTIYQPFGELSDAQWRHLAETGMRRTDDGLAMPHYDPKMVMMITRHPDELVQWDAYDRIRARTLCMRGATSDVLLPDTAVEMTRRGPHCRLETIEGCGHAPALNNPAQWRLVEEFLE